MPSSAPQVLTTVTVWDYLYGPNKKPVVGERVSLIPGWTQATTIAPVTTLEPIKIDADAPTDANGYWQCTAVVPLDLILVLAGDYTYTVKDPINGDYRIQPLTTSASYQASALRIGGSVVPNFVLPNFLVGALTAAGLLTAQAGLTVSGGGVVLPAGSLADGVMATPPSHPPFTQAQITGLPTALASAVHQTGNENIAGTKTFASPPIGVPPTGSVTMFGAAAAPAGWLNCDGAAVSRATYAALFGVIATVYGVGDGATTFNLPDLRGRVPLGIGTGVGLSPRALNDQPGEENHVLATGEMPSHNHGVVDAGFTPTAINENNPAGAVGHYGRGAGPNPFTTSNVGGGGGHNTMQPSLGLNFIIKT